MLETGEHGQRPCGMKEVGIGEGVWEKASVAGAQRG